MPILVSTMFLMARIREICRRCFDKLAKSLLCHKENPHFFISIKIMSSCFIHLLDTPRTGVWNSSCIGFSSSQTSASVFHLVDLFRAYNEYVGNMQYADWCELSDTTLHLVQVGVPSYPSMFSIPIFQVLFFEGKTRRYISS